MLITYDKKNINDSPYINGNFIFFGFGALYYISTNNTNSISYQFLDYFEDDNIPPIVNKIKFYLLTSFTKEEIKNKFETNNIKITDKEIDNIIEEFVKLDFYKKVKNTYILKEKENTQRPDFINNFILDIGFNFEENTDLEQSNVYMLYVANNNYDIRPINISSKYNHLTETDFDLNYGKGFLKFHKNLLEIFKNENKGLIILHGSPGTGKSYYIKNLLKESKNINKKIVYVPKNMVSDFLNPNFMTFLMEWIIDNKNKAIFLLEDAEDVILDRNSSKIDDGGVSNILNMSDGILNDVLGIQIILTFNTDINNVDKALLRKERLLAIKEFKELSKKDAEKLVTKLKIKFSFDDKKDSYSLAEIYSQKRTFSLLEHILEEDTNTITKQKTKKPGFINYAK